MQRVQALAQHGLDRRFPSRVDAQLLPELRSVAESVPLDPLT